MSVTVKVLDAKKEIASHKVPAGKVLVLEAQSNVNYQLINDQTGFGPQNIITKRQGDDLVIFLEDGNMNEDIIIKGYYGENGTSNMIVGLHENGQIYAYVPESGKAAESISVLAEEVIAPQALGGTELVTPFWAFNPWWIAGAAGIIALAASGGGGGGLPQPDPRLAKAERLVQLAEQADKAAEKKAQEIQDKIKNGLVVSADDLSELEALNQAVLDREKAAADYIDKNGFTSQFKTRLDEVKPSEAAANATDKDNDGVADAREEETALKLIELAEAAEKAAEEKLAEIQKKAAENGGVISQRDVNELKALNEAVLARKAAADEAVKGLPNSSDKKTEYAGRVKAVDPTNEPLVNDKDNNGTKDSLDAQAQKKLVEELVKAAENAEKLAEDFRKDALKDGIVSKAEADTLAALNKAVTDRKTAAQKALAELPVADQTAFTPRLKAVSPTAPLSVTDKDNDGKIDTAENKLAENLTRETEEAHARLVAEKTRLDEKAKDGKPISQAELDNFNQLNDTFAKTKAAAEKAIAELTGTEFDSNKDGFTDKIKDLRAQELADATKQNDYDNDGIVDTKEVEKVNNLIKAAEEAQKAAEKALGELAEKAAQPNAVISQTEIDALNALNKVVEEKKAAAQKAFDGLPTTNPDITAEKRDELKGKIDAITTAGADPQGTQIPTANDKDNDGVDDAQQKPNAADLLAKAKAAAEKAKALSDKLLANPSKNEPVSASDIELLKAYNAETAALKAAAQKAIADLPASDDKAAMETAAKQVQPAFVPAVTDKDNDGKIDTAEKAKAEKLFDEAQALKLKLNEKYGELTAEGKLRTPVEVAEFNRLHAELNAKIAEAQKAYEDTPDKPAGKDATSLENDIPKVATNDSDGDGVDDKQEAVNAEALKTKANEIAREMAELAGTPTEANQAIYNELKKQFDAVKDAFDKAVAAIPDTTGDNEPVSKPTEITEPTEFPPLMPPTTTDDKIEALLKATEDAYAKAEALKAQLEAEGAVVSKADIELLNGLNRIIESNEQALRAEIATLPKGTAEEQRKIAGYNARFEPDEYDIDPIMQVDLSTLTVNDTNNDGIADQSAYDLLKDARAAERQANAEREKILAKPVISQADVELLNALNDAINAKKAAALVEINKLGTAEKATLTEQHNAIKTVEVPAVKEGEAATDGIQALIDAALAADARAEAQKAAILEKDVFSQADKALLDALNQDLATKKAAAEKAINALPDGTAKDGFNAQLTPNTAAGDKADKLAPKTLPETKTVNDADNDGMIDGGNNDVEKLVALAEAAEKAAEAKRDEIQTKAAQNGGVISKADTDALAELNKLVEAAKAKADTAVKALPNPDTKDILEERLGKVDTAELAPNQTANDLDNDGEKDSDSLGDLVAQAKEAETAAKALLKAINDDAAKNNGVVSQTDIDALNKLNDEVTAKKAVAQAAINELKNANPDAATAFQTELNKVQPAAPIPAVTDSNNDGVADSQVKADIAKLLAAAQAAETAAQAKADAIAQQDLISQADKDALDALNNDLAAKKAALNAAIKQLPEAEQATEQGKADDITSPVAFPNDKVVNDTNNDGINDSEQTNELNKLIEAAQAAQQKAQAKLDEMNTAKENGTPISQADVDVLKALNEEVTAAKDKAENAKAELEKAGLLTDAQKDETTGATPTIEKIEPVVVPAVEDSNNNLDSDTSDVAAAEALVKAAEDVAQKAADKLAEINANQQKDGVVSAADVDVLNELNRLVESKKAAAQQAIDSLPPSEEKDKLDAREDEVKPVTAPEVVTDNSNDLEADNDDLKAAADLVRQAEAAEKAAEAKRDEIAKKLEETGVLSQADKDKLDELNDKVADLKQQAQAAIDNLPDSADKQGLTERAEGVEPSELANNPDSDTPPAVNDTNNNGVDDEKELDNVKALIQAAEKAQQDAQAVKGDLEQKLEQKGILSADDQARLDAANAELKAKTDAANKALEKLPEELKAQLTGDVAPTVLENNTPETLGTDEAPVTVNDADNDGIKDSDELAKAQRLVEEAKKATEEAKALGDKLAAAEKAGEPVSQADVDKLKQLNDVVNAKEQAAQQAVDSLPPSAEKDKLDNTLKGDDVKPFEPVPTVSDSDNDGVKDGDTTTQPDVAALVKAAEEAQQAIDKKLEEIKDKFDETGAVSEADKQALDALNKDLEAKKDAAQQAVDKLPAEDKGTYPETLQPLTTKGLGDIGGDVPANVNDSDNDGVPDTQQEAADKTRAEDLLAAAIAAEKRAQDKLNEINDKAAQNGGVVSQADVEALEALNADVVARKAAAKAAIEALPDSPEKTGMLADEADIQPVDVPSITDVDNDGSKDSEAEIKALEAVKAAEAAEKAAEDAKQALENGKAISPQDVAALEELNKQVEDLKAKAQQAVDELPDDSKVKQPLDERAEAVNPVATPEITPNNSDSNNDGVPDSEQLSDAQDAVNAAEEAVKAANKALSDAAKDPAISPNEVAALQQKVDEAQTALDDAKAAVDALPDTLEGKAELADKLAGLQPEGEGADKLNTAVPPVTDSNDNGTPDSQDVSDAQQAVQDAKAKVDAANQALQDAEGTGITEDERADLKQAVEDAKNALAAAQEKLDEVPNDNPVKQELAAELEQLSTKNGENDEKLNEIPEEGNDSNNNNVPDEKELTDAKAKVDPLADKIADFNRKAGELAAENPTTPEEQKAWADKKAELEQEKAKLADEIKAAQQAVNDVPDNTTSEDDPTLTKSGLNDQLGELPTLADLPKDDNGNGIPDSQDFEDAKQAYEDAKQKVAGINDKIKEINDALANPTPDNADIRAVTPEELAQLKQEADDANKALQDAVQKLAEVPTDYGKPAGETPVDGTGTTPQAPTNYDQLSDALADLSVAPLPMNEANSTPNGGNGDKPDADLVAEAEKALNDAKKAVDDFNEKLKGIVKADDKPELDQEKQAADQAVADAKAKIEALPDTLPEKAKLLEKVTEQAKPKTDEVKVNDSDNDGITDEAEKTKYDELKQAVLDAKQAYENAVAQLKQGKLEGYKLTNAEVETLQDKIAAFNTAKAAAEKYVGDDGEAKDLYHGGAENNADKATKADEIKDITIDALYPLTATAASNTTGGVEIKLPDATSLATEMRVKYFEQSGIRFNNEEYAIGIEREVVLTRPGISSQWTLVSTEGVQVKSLGEYGLFAYDRANANTSITGGTSSRAWTISQTEADLSSAQRTEPITIAKDGVALKEAIYFSGGKIVIPGSELRGDMPVTVTLSNAQQVNQTDGDSSLVTPAVYKIPALALDNQLANNVVGIESVSKEGNQIKITMGSGPKNLAFSYQKQGEDGYTELYLHRASSGTTYLTSRNNIYDPKGKVGNAWYEHSQYLYGYGFSNYLYENGRPIMLSESNAGNKLVWAVSTNGGSNSEIILDATQLEANSVVNILGFRGFREENYIHSQVNVTTGTKIDVTETHELKLVEDNGTINYIAYNKVSEIQQKDGGNVKLTGFGDHLLVDTELKFNIDGGAGTDTVKLTHNTVDLAKFSNVEIIDLSHTGAQTVTNITAETLAKNDGLKIKGDNQDSITLDGETQGNDVVDGAVTYHSYTIGDKTVLIQDGITVI